MVNYNLWVIYKFFTQRYYTLIILYRYKSTFLFLESVQERKAVTKTPKKNVDFFLNIVINDYFNY